MQRRRFLKLFGVAAAASVVSSQLPAVPMAPIPVTAIPVVAEDLGEIPLECAVEPECVAEMDAHIVDRSNPHHITRSDMNVSNAKKTFERYYRDSMEVPFTLPRH